MHPERYIAVFFVCAQNDRYTVGGQDMFDTLTDLVEYYKRKGIEEISGNWVYFKQVKLFYFFLMMEIKQVRPCNMSDKVNVRGL